VLNGWPATVSITPRNDASARHELSASERAELLGPKCAADSPARKLI
jgi:hypothetical protein